MYQLEGKTGYALRMLAGYDEFDAVIKVYFY